MFLVSSSTQNWIVLEKTWASQHNVVGRNRMIATINYRLFQKDKDYVVIDEGIDWYLVKVQGKAVYTYKWLFDEWLIYSF